MIRQWHKDFKEWFNSDNFRMLAEHYTLEVWWQFKMLVKQEVDLMKKDRWAINTFFTLAVLFGITRLWSMTIMCLAAMAFFHLRHTIRSRVYVETFRRRYKEKARRMKSGV